MSIWPKNIAHLNISSWVGISIGANHCYGKLNYQDEDRIEIKRILTHVDADKLNDYDRNDVFESYNAGDECTRFDTEQEIIDSAIEIIKKDYPQVDLLLARDGASISVNEVYWGKDQKVVDRINELYKEADKLGYYSGKDDDRMEELDDEFEKLVGLELL